MDRSDLILLEDNQDILVAETKMAREEAKHAWTKPECICMAIAIAFACGLLPYLTIKTVSGEMTVLAASLWALGAAVMTLVTLLGYTIYREHVTTDRVI